MNENDSQFQDFNRRDFLKSSSVATLMTMLGGVELAAQTNAAPAGASDAESRRIKTGVIGVGGWGREIVSTLALLLEPEDIVAICDTYPNSTRRCAKDCPKAAQTEDYKTIIENKDIKAVIVATPTHQHKDIVLAALKAGKHVYCEAPLANTIEDAQAIAQAAKAASKQQIFQAGFQMRADKQRLFLLPFIRSGALGDSLMGRAQWHKKQSWRATSPNAEREKQLNWRLNKETSVGLIGEIGSHQLDQACWYLNTLPVAVSGLGSIALYKDGRDVPDTVQAVLEFPGGVFLNYDATLANSFEGAYEMLYGSFAAVMMRDEMLYANYGRVMAGDGQAWLFKEADSQLLGWEIYARKDIFYKETGIALVADASKSTPSGSKAPPKPFENTPLYHALDAFLRNSAGVTQAIENYTSTYGADDPEAVAAEAAKVIRRAASGYLEGYRGTVLAIKANEAVLKAQRLELKPEWFKLT